MKTPHRAGAVRFSREPDSSALDVHRKAHDLDNLHVVGMNHFPGIGAANHSPTAVANPPPRGGDDFVERLQ